MVEPAFATLADDAYLHQAKELAQVGSAVYGVWQGCEEMFSKLTTPLTPGNSTTFCVAGPTDPSGFVKTNIGQSGFGHHFVPVSVIRNYAQQMTSAAMEIAFGNVSGPIYPSHDYRAMGGVKHSRYNEIVGQELNDYMKANKIKKMNADQMLDFSELMRNGKNHDGTVNKELKNFNDAIDCERNAYVNGGRNRGGVPRPNTQKKLKDWLRNRGRNYRFRVNLHSAFLLSAVGGSLLSGYTDALAIAAKSHHFKNAMDDLVDGRVDRAERHLFGGTSHQTGFVGELNAKGCDKAAAHFRDAWFKASLEAQNDQHRIRSRPWRGANYDR